MWVTALFKENAIACNASACIATGLLLLSVLKRRMCGNGPGAILFYECKNAQLLIYDFTRGMPVAITVY